MSNTLENEKDKAVAHVGSAESHATVPATASSDEARADAGGRAPGTLVCQEVSVPYGDNELKLVDGYQRMFAEIVGPFAIHPSFRLSGYTLTHIKSGFAVTSQWATVEQLRTLASDLLTLGLDWDFTDFKVARQSQYDAVRPLLQQHRAKAEGR